MSLDSLITDNHKFSIKEIIRISRQLCSVVKYLHDNGIYHQDIKSENIIYNAGNIRLIDYGNAVHSTKMQKIRMGSKWYAAPEVYDGKPGDERQDIYSIGVVMLMMAAGKPDMDAIKSCPQAFGSVVAKCLAHQSIRRYRSVSELDNALYKINTKKSVTGNTSRRILFMGAHSHCGTTHCARMAAAFFSASGRKVLLREINRSKDLIHIIFESGRVYLDRGIFSAFGMNCLPYSGGCVAWDFEQDYDIIIYDCGDLISNAVREDVHADEVCIVTGARGYELQGLKDIYSEVCKTGVCDGAKLHTLLNFCDAGLYMKAVRTGRVENPIRVPYMPDIRGKILKKQGRIFCAEKR